MTERPAAREGDPTSHGEPLEAGVGIDSVQINGRSAWSSRDAHVCSKHGTESVVHGGNEVLVGGRSIAREGDFLMGGGAPNRIVAGSPDVFVGAPAVGIAAADKVSSFCAGYCALKRDWKDLTPEERERRYRDVLGKLFATFGAPPPNVDQEAPSFAAAAFSGQKWTVKVPPGTFAANEPPSGSATFHEARHAEQYFAGLRDRMSPRPGQTPPDTDEVARQTGAPYEIVFLAGQRPVDSNGPDAGFARVMGEAFFSREGRAELKDAVDRVEAAPERDQRAVYEATYMKLPVGLDATDVADLGDCGGCQ